MLTHLYVKDLAIVSTLELELHAGMSALTGETGAGKSILIDALGLALGDKTDNAMIRAGCERAEISAEFDVGEHAPAQAWLRDNALDDDSQCILRRQLVRNARSRTYVNGRPVPMQQLAQLGELLVDIHGQHAHQSLLRVNEQRRLLDEYAGIGEAARRLAELYRRYHAAQAQLDDTEASTRDRQSRRELLEFQRGELEALGVSRDELEQLDAEQRRLRNTGVLQATCGRLLQVLYDDEQCIQSQLDQAAADLEELQTFSDSLDEAKELIEGASIQVQEAAAGLRGFAEGLELDPQRLEVVEQRISDIHDAARKYRVNPEDLPERLQQIVSELDKLENSDQALDQLREQVATLRERFIEQAGKLSGQRQSAAKRLSKTVSKTMHTLGMSGGSFLAQVTPLPQAQANAHGLDAVEFMVTANPGQPARPLAKVASGGELSRISLAIQVATAQCDQVPTLIFDEVDVGIGGGVAEIVGQLLRQLGDSRQVLCVTHLPQVAAQAHRHLRVKKYTKSKQTFTGISPLASQERVEEVARMLGGVEITQTTLEHAREMIGGGAEP